MNKTTVLVAVLMFFSSAVFSQPQLKPSFKVVPLGVRGGLDESNLSAYMIAAEGTDDYICADAGTIRFGIEKAITNKAFKTGASDVFKNYIKGYLVSHAHLDHVAGLIMNSPDDTAKNIYAMPYVINILKDKYFNWQSWANFANEGDKPALNKYHYVSLEEEKDIPVANTQMSVQAFSLSHSNPYESTAFLVNSSNHFLLYLGDTGADSVEKSGKLSKLWQSVAPLVKSGQLKAIFIEVSFPDEQPDKLLFGHLTPKWLMQEMKTLSRFSGEQTLRKVNIVITHRKPPLKNEQKIKAQLTRQNVFGLRLIYPVQGSLMRF